MATSAMCEPASAGYAVSGAFAVQQQSGLPESLKAALSTGNSSWRRARLATGTAFLAVPLNINVRGLVLCLGFAIEPSANALVENEKGPGTGPFRHCSL